MISRKRKTILMGASCLFVLALLFVAAFVSTENSGHSGSSKSIKYESWAKRVAIDPQKKYKVQEAVDGDTLKAIIDGHVITVRLLGIDTPETVDPRKVVGCFGPEASAETKSLVDGRSVHIELNEKYDRTDKYGRLLAYVRRASDSLFLNEFLVREGYAREYTFDAKKPYRYQVLFRSDESEAKKAGKGLWGKCGAEK